MFRLDMSRKKNFGVQLSTVFNIVSPWVQFNSYNHASNETLNFQIYPVRQQELYANFWIYFLILRCSSMLVKFSITGAFALAAVLWLKSEVSMICINLLHMSNTNK